MNELMRQVLRAQMRDKIQMGRYLWNQRSWVVLFDIHYSIKSLIETRH